MPKYELIDHTADVGIIAHGETVEEVFINAAHGMFNIIGDMNEVDEVISLDITVEAPDQEELLVTWLNELLYLFDAENLIFSRFEVLNLTKEHLTAIAHGEPVDLARHHLKTQVKAATYHMLKLREQDGFRAQIILDV